MQVPAWATGLKHPKAQVVSTEQGQVEMGIQRRTRVSQIRSVHTGEHVPWPTGSTRHNERVWKNMQMMRTA